MTKLILHIGLQKTGTTFLQQNFTARAGRLRKVGVHYLSPQGNLPTQKESPAHHWIVAAIRNMRNTYIPDVPFSFLPTYVTNLREKIERDDYPLALMSSENFSRMDDEEVAELRRLFDGIDTEIVVYLRRQDLWIDSWYAQTVKVGGRRGLEETIEESRDFLDYRNLLNRWGAHFGQDRIKIGIYEKLDTPHALWSDFFRLIGSEAAESIDLQVESANVTLAPQLTKFIEVAQKTTGYNPTLRRFLENVNSQFEHVNTLKFMAKDRAEALLRDYDEANTEIARRYFGRDTLFADTEIHGSDHVYGLTIEDLVNIIAGSNIALLQRISNLEHGASSRPKAHAGTSRRKPRGGAA